MDEESVEELETLVRLKLLTHNARLVDTRKEQGWTQIQAAKLAGMRLTRLAHIENLKVVPTDLEMDDLSGVLGKPVEYLFPKTILSAITSGVFDRREVDLSEVKVAALGRGILMKALPLVSDGCDDIDRKVDKELLKKQVAEILQSLNPRERMVIEMRFGLNDGWEKTQEEVARHFNLTRARIYQIEAKALRKLRHPSRSRKLKDYLD